jgi:serine/threonine protein kinase
MEKSFKYEKLIKIGEGAYGCVYQSRNVITGEIVAQKTIKCDKYDEGISSTTLR